MAPHGILQEFFYSSSRECHVTFQKALRKKEGADGAESYRCDATFNNNSYPSSGNNKRYKSRTLKFACRVGELPTGMPPKVKQSSY